MSEELHDDAVEGGNYDVIRARLTDQGEALREAAAALNARRTDLFGSTELKILGEERVRTENKCVPVDIVQVSGALLFGYNVQLGLKREMALDDVLSLHAFRQDDGGFSFDHIGPEGPRAFLDDRTLQREFTELYQYYKDARLIQLRVTAGRLLAVFQTGATTNDVKVLRWAVDPGTRVTYMDNRGERDHVFPPSHDFEWVKTTREDHSRGRHAHVNIADTVFVETIGGDLTIKVEDNTQTGEGIYSEPVLDANQSLDDADIRFAKLGSLVLLAVRPFREEATRHFVYNANTRSAHRIDAIGTSCVQLPEDHGILFPGGYYLGTGEVKVFDHDLADLEFVTRIPAPNGEDLLYVFHRRSDGMYALYAYNMIRKEVATPIHAHGYSLFDDGTLAVFRATADAVRVHAIQVWQTPFVSEEHYEGAPNDGSMLGRVGNRELVRGISDAFTLTRLVTNTEPNRTVYEELIGSCTRFVDAYYWASSEDAGDLRSLVAEVRRTAELIVDEFEKVQVLRRRAKEVIAEATLAHDRLMADHRVEFMNDIDAFLDGMTALRRHRGHVITLREVRYVDLEVLDKLEAATVARFDAISQATVGFLVDEDAYGPLERELETLLSAIEEVTKAVDLQPLAERLSRASEGVNLLSEVVANLDVDDPTIKARILDELSGVFASANRVRAVLERKRGQLRSAEGKAEFVAQFKLFEQSIAGALGRCDSPEACDEQLSRLLLQLEELEGRFGDFEAFLGDLADKRESVYEAITTRKQSLLEARQQRIESIVSAGQRILEGVGRRARSFKEEDALNAWFAGDAMVLKLRQLTTQLVDLGDTVRSEELAAKLKSARQDALRGLRDKAELFDGTDLIKLGRHRFTENKEPLELTLVPRESGLHVHLTGTDYYELVEDEAFADTRPFWSQTLVSENSDVYRGEYLAACILFDAEDGTAGLNIAALERAALSADELLALVRSYASERYEEGYDRGIHDRDAAAILGKLVGMRSTAGVLRFPAEARVLATLFWAFATDRPAEAWVAEARALGRLRSSLGVVPTVTRFMDHLGEAIAAWHETAGFDVHGSATRLRKLAGAYLFEELARPETRFVFAQPAATLRDGLLRWLEDHGGEMSFEDALKPLGDRFARRYAVKRAWLQAFAAQSSDERMAKLEVVADEAAALLLTARKLDTEISAVPTEVTLEGLLGQHSRIDNGKLVLRLDRFLGRLRQFRGEVVPAYHAYRERRAELVDRHRRRLRLDELKPRVMTSFVRNQLINEVYLPMVGDNLAKQMGAAGNDKRTDLMGLLLLVSPPGYGKTTLMEYVASRLGLVFVKVNGPSLGHDVKSLDPAEAPNATARQEVDKINLALEMGNNVMLYLDDIQHTHPELLQKFISLCDAQRRIEGVWKGRTRTYDLRGKKFCVIMAGNPYTESGDKFQIPDMLANRADTYNLGDVLSGRERQFAMSFIENSVTSSPALSPLATRPQSDLYLLSRMAQGEEVPVSELSHDYASVELDEIRATLVHLFRCRDTLLKVNALYVSSAAMEDGFRTEPRFQLQGSYRNMNKLAEKVVPAMTEDEVEALIRDHYQGEAQTLTSGAEANLLKLGELRGTLVEEQVERWEKIRIEFRRMQLLGGDDDPASRIGGVLSGAVQELQRMAESMEGSSGLEAGVAGLQGELVGLREAVVASSERPLDLGAVAASVDGLRDALGGGSPDVVKGLRMLAKVVQQSAAKGLDLAPVVTPLQGIEQRLGVQPVSGATLDDLLVELVAMRETLAAGGVASSAAEAPKASRRRVAKQPGPAAQQEAMLRHAWAALDGKVQPKPAGEPLLVAAVEVIEQLTTSLVAGTKARLPPGEQQAFVDEVKRSVAEAVTSIARQRGKAD